MVSDVAVVGGGLVGASLARALDRAGLSCTLIERSVPREPHPDEWDSRVYAISPGARAFLADIGAWQELDARRVAPVLEMKVFGDRDSQLRFSAYECGVERLATIVEAGSLQHALWRALPSHRRLRVVCPAKPVSLELLPGHAEIGIEGAAPLQARLVVGADGANSWVREAAGISVHRAKSRQVAVVANFTCEQAHHGVAYQWFRDDGVLAWLPLAGNRISMVWSTDPERAAGLEGAPPAELCDTVSSAGGHSLGALGLLTAAQSFPVAPLDANGRARSRVTLIGDAAHVIHPLAGQGVNLGFGDARALARILAGCGPDRDPGDRLLLRRFERERAEDILAMRLATGGLQRLFAATYPAAAAARNVGLNLTDRMPVLKNLLARRAMQNG
jgi:2-octaprenylphenol hydroxylase